MGDTELVSCLCLTRHRVRLLARAVACFLHQSYPARELVIVYESDDVDTREYVGSLNDPRIRPVEVAKSEGLFLGGLRNRSIDASRGHYVAQWDDDDWHAPGRLEAQIESVRNSGKQGCLLSRTLVYDGLTDTAYLSTDRGWECSLVAERGAMPAYPNLAKGEDTPPLLQMSADGKLVGLNRPDLYIYTYHGANTWERAHWDQRLLPFFDRLPAEDQMRVRALLGDPHG